MTLTRLFLTCTCGTEGLAVTRDPDDDAVEISTWTLGSCGNRPPLSVALRAARRVMTRRRPDYDQVTLTTTDGWRLANHLACESKTSPATCNAGPTFVTTREFVFALNATVDGIDFATFRRADSPGGMSPFAAVRYAIRLLFTRKPHVEVARITLDEASQLSDAMSHVLGKAR